jgi:hypothetical protein
MQSCCNYGTAGAGPTAAGYDCVVIPGALINTPAASAISQYTPTKFGASKVRTIIKLSQYTFSRHYFFTRMVLKIVLRLITKKQ